MLLLSLYSGSLLECTAFKSMYECTREAKLLILPSTQLRLDSAPRACLHNSNCLNAGARSRRMMRLAIYSSCQSSLNNVLHLSSRILHLLLMYSHGKHVCTLYHLSMYYFNTT